MLDVHPPHTPMHGVREFFLHLFTITIGLLIALSLEGLVEWRHHRHLVHEAEASLHVEIAGNVRGMADGIANLHAQQAMLKQDISVLKYITKNHKAPERSELTIDFHFQTFQAVSWKTAQTTGALAYMPYDRAQEYSEIYTMQDLLSAAVGQAARDAIVGLGALMNTSEGGDPTGGRSDEIEGKIEVLQGQLLLVDALMKGLDRDYKQFLQNHPE